MNFIEGLKWVLETVLMDEKKYIYFTFHQYLLRFNMRIGTKLIGN